MVYSCICDDILSKQKKKSTASASRNLASGATAAFCFNAISLSFSISRLARPHRRETGRTAALLNRDKSKRMPHRERATHSTPSNAWLSLLATPTVSPTSMPSRKPCPASLAFADDSKERNRCSSHCSPPNTSNGWPSHLSLISSLLGVPLHS